MTDHTDGVLVLRMLTLAKDVVHEWRGDKGDRLPFEAQDGWVRHGNRLSHCRAPHISFPFGNSCCVRDMLWNSMSHTKMWTVCRDLASNTEVLVVRVSCKLVEGYRLGESEPLYRIEGHHSDAMELHVLTGQVVRMRRQYDSFAPLNAAAETKLTVS